jgi:hypothetical protein
MASKFTILIHRNSDNLHLGLSGDFDGSSAYKLINVLKKKHRGVHRVIIHTNRLKEIYPFGQDVFRENLSNLMDKPFQLLFTGEKAGEIAPGRMLS